MINLFPEIKDQIEAVLRSDVLQKNADIELQQRALEYFKVFYFLSFSLPYQLHQSARRIRQWGHVGHRARGDAALSRTRELDPCQVEEEKTKTNTVHDSSYLTADSYSLLSSCFYILVNGAIHT